MITEKDCRNLTLADLGKLSVEMEKLQDEAINSDIADLLRNLKENIITEYDRLKEKQDTLTLINRAKRIQAKRQVGDLLQEILQVMPDCSDDKFAEKNERVDQIFDMVCEL